MGAIRLFLAIAVALGHLNVIIFPDMPTAQLLLFGTTGTHAVMLFFVVSGFLMSLVLDEKYLPGKAGTLAFYRARFLRIYPLWWALLAIIVVFVDRSWLSSPRADLISTVTLLGPELRTAFADYPQLHSTLPGPLGVGWSLGVEVLFYICAPFLLRSTKLCAVLLVAFSASRYGVYLWQSYGDAWTRWNYFFFPNLLPFFLAGHFARLMWKWLPIPTWLGLLAFSASLGAMYQSYGGAFDNQWFYVSVGFFAISLPPLFALTKTNRIMNWLGDLTYPLYLTHSLVISATAIIPLADMTLGAKFHLAIVTLPFPPLAQFAVASAIVLPLLILIAVITRNLVERPARIIAEGLLTLAQLPAATPATRLSTPARFRGIDRPT